jgi:enoyl-CoA hydratase
MKSSKVNQKANSGHVKACVLTGQGHAFSAGGDLKWLYERTQAKPIDNEKTMIDFYSRFLLPLRNLPVPTIAAINGPAIGAGAAVSLACDMRVACHNAKIGFTFVGLGLHPGMGSTHFLPLIAGYENASRLLLSGEIVSGEEALKLRVVGEVAGEVADDCHACVETAMKRANMIAKAGPIAVQSNLISLRRKMDEGLRLALQREAGAQALCYATSDFAEGLDAIKTKRRPEFGGM